MGESHHHHHHQPSPRLGMKNTTAGEIVEVQGGHIVRSTGRKDRHSKVCTAKGPRDRRVRLSAHTAIQFYDVQDRLGYDRPSKAVDWLIKKAKAAIDELAELPAWLPTSTNPNQNQEAETQQNPDGDSDAMVGGSSSKKLVETEQGVSGYNFQHLNDNNHPTDSTASFFPASLAAIKSFLPIPSSSSIHFQNYPPTLLSRTSSQTQDLRLSLQSFQDPILLHHHQENPSSTDQTLFSGSALAFDAPSASWSEHQQQQQQQQNQQEMGRFQRMVAWNTSETSSGGGFAFSTPPSTQFLQPFLGQNPLFSQRGPLQSSNSPSVRAWTAEIPAMSDRQTPNVHPSPSISGFGFASDSSFCGFRIPARIQGEEEHDTVDHKPSTASYAPRH